MEVEVEVEVLAELLDMARMMCSSNLEEMVEARMVEILEYAAEIETLTLDAVKIFNEAVCQKFENFEKKFIGVLEFDRVWGYSNTSEEFVNFSFLALKRLLEAFNENEKDEVEEG